MMSPVAASSSFEPSLFRFVSVFLRVSVRPPVASVPSVSSPSVSSVLVK
jgi:hypothetical protein